MHTDQLNDDRPANVVCNLAAHLLLVHEIDGNGRELVFRLSGDFTCANNREAMEFLVRQQCWLDVNASVDERRQFFGEIQDRVAFALWAAA